MRSTFRTRRARPTRNPQSGGSVVEFAIVLPLFFAFLFGTVDYGWYLYQKFTLASAVQKALRTAVSVKEADVPGPWATANSAATTALTAAGISGATCGPALTTNQLTGVKPQRALNLTCTFTFVPLVGLVKMPSPTLSHTGTMLLDAQNANI